jgi:pyruvate dehydrogenase E1 component alpha subunit
MGQSRDLLLEAVKIRRIEEHIIEIYPSDLIQSPLHLSIGQEALAVGVCANLNQADQVFTSYRSHAYYIAKGGNLNHFFAELMGRSTGCCKGKGGSMHLADSSVNFMGTSAIVASTLPHAVGAAYANKFKGNSNLVVCIFGDGAADAGVYHESINFAALHKLPIIFVLEDNGLAVHSTKAQRQAFDLAKHASTYGLLSYNLEETHSPEVVANLMERVIKDVRTKKQAAWVRLKAFRYKEHVGTGDDFNVGYRSQAEYEAWMHLDPISSYRASANVEASIRQEIEEAVNYGINSPFPTYEDLHKDVS